MSSSHGGGHGGDSPFDRQVAVTMAVIAAFLACLTMFSHGAESDTLRFQIEAGVLQTKASDQWSFYQAKNIRQHEYASYLTLLPLLAKAPDQDAAVRKAREDWAKQVEKYDAELLKMKEEAERLEQESKECQEKSHHAHARGGRLGLGELGIELALVICSLAILTKRPMFWHLSIVIGLLGLGVGLSAFHLP